MARTGMVDSRRFKLYGVYYANSTIYENTEAGPPSQLPPQVLYDTRRTIRPTGGMPETTADAEHQPLTEEEEAPVSDFYCSPVPRVNDCSSDIRNPRPDAPAAKGYHAPIASGIKKIFSSCEYGRRRYQESSGSSRLSQATWLGETSLSPRMGKLERSLIIEVWPLLCSTGVDLYLFAVMADDFHPVIVSRFARHISEFSCFEIFTVDLSALILRYLCRAGLC